MKYDNEAVLSMWADGVPAPIIGRRLGITQEYVRTIVIRARHKGDERSINRPRGGINRFSLSVKAHKNLVAEAEQREISELELASLILENVADDKLFAAVLDN